MWPVLCPPNGDGHGDAFTAFSSPADGNSLQVKLNAALAALPGDPATAISSCQSFIKQVKVLNKIKRLSAANGQPLIDASQAIIADLSA
jgi:hypothetical protein